MTRNVIFTIECLVDGVLEHQVMVHRDRECIARVGVILRPVLATIRQLFVVEAYRKQGIGAELVRECIDVARKHGCRTINLIVDSSNQPVIPFYTKLGFFPGFQFSEGDVVMAMPIQEVPAKS